MTHGPFLGGVLPYSCLRKRTRHLTEPTLEIGDMIEQRQASTKVYGKYLYEDEAIVAVPTAIGFGLTDDHGRLRSPL